MIKTLPGTVIAMLLLISWSLALPMVTEAGVQICNRSSNAVWLALAESRDGMRHSYGWYRLGAGVCDPFFGAELKSHNYYGYAFDEDGNTWGGASTFCVHPGTNFYISGSDYCGDRFEGAKSRGFFEIDTGSGVEVTHELSRFEDPAPLAKPEDLRATHTGSLEAAWDRQDYEAVLAWVQPAAEDGEAWALNLLGLMYLYGYGVPKSHREGIKRIEQAAALGWGKAQYNLARLLYESPEGEANLEQVMIWLHRAASQGVVAARQSLQTIQQTPELVKPATPRLPALEKGS